MSMNILMKIPGDQGELKRNSVSRKKFKVNYTPKHYYVSEETLVRIQIIIYHKKNKHDD